MTVFSKFVVTSFKSLRYGKSIYNANKLNSIKIFKGFIGFSVVYGCYNIFKPNDLIIKAVCKSKNLSEENTPKNIRIFRNKKFWMILYPDIILFILAVAAAIIAAIVNVRIPIEMGKVVDVINKFETVAQSEFLNIIKKPSIRLLSTYLLQALSTTAYISLLSIMGEHLAVRLRKKLFERIIIQDSLFFDTKKSGNLLNRMTSDVQEFKSSFKQCISHGLRSSIQIIGSTIALFMVSQKLTIIVFIAIPSMVALGSLMGKLLRSLSREYQSQNAKATEVVSESLSNIRTIKSFAMEDIEIEKFSIEIEKAGSMASFLGVGIGFFQGISNLAINGLVFGVLFAGGYMLNSGEVSGGELISFLVATQTIQKSLATVSTIFGQAVRASSAGVRIFEYIDLTDPITSPKLDELKQLRQNKSPINPQPIERRDDSTVLYKNTDSLKCLNCASVHLKNVSFKYPSRDDVILHNINLDIPSGSIVALCGQSGAGKSTIASLVQRLYDPIEGSVKLDNLDVRDIPVAQLRTHHIGVVSQQPQLFAMSILENIRYSRLNATDAEVIQAAKYAHAHDFIEKFSEGYSTVVGERGGESLSGGQRQRIAIARAFLRNPRVLILDEATSALDPASEILVQEALKRVMKGRTVIVIAHRLSTIRHADTIVVLKNGKIMEMGPHDQLMKLDGYYTDLVKKQERNVK